MLAYVAGAPFAAGQAPTPGSIFNAAWPGVVAEFEAACTGAGVVGASLMFVHGDRVLGLATHGLADRAHGRPVDRDTIYHWASITKTFTGIAILQLRDRGKLQLDQPLVDFVPEFRAVHAPHGPLRNVTLRHLLTHSAGLRGPTWPWGGDKHWHPHEPTDFAQIVAMLPYTEIEFPPGSRFSYSNPGIVFLGRVLENLTGDDYEVYVDKNILRPLGMTRSYFDLTPYHLGRHRSHSYDIKNEEPVDLGPDFDTGVTVSNGGLNAPLPDMARYLAFLLGACPPDSDAAQVLPRTSLAEMWQPALPTGGNDGSHIGLTFFVLDKGGSRFLGHTGGQRGFVTFFYVHPDSGTGALGAFNTGTAGPAMARLRTLCMEKLSLAMCATPSK